MKITASSKAREKGLSSLAEVGRMTGQSTQTLNNWHNNKEKLFEIVLIGCSEAKKESKGEL